MKFSALEYTPIRSPTSACYLGRCGVDRYRKASARVHIFLDKPRPGSLTPSEDSADEDDQRHIIPEVSVPRHSNTVILIRTSICTLSVLFVRMMQKILVNARH